MASQSHAVTLAVLRALRGPNILGPLPGVYARCYAQGDITTALRTALKDICQRAGIVLASLQSHAMPAGVGWQSELWFQTPLPELGAAATRLAVAQVDAGMSGQEWDDEDAFFALAAQRRREALPLAALQMLAEAAARQVPAFQYGDVLQLGYGVHGRRLALVPQAGETIALVGQHEPPRDPVDSVDWSQLGRIPIIAVTGRDAGAVVAKLQHQLPHASALPHAAFDDVRTLLATGSVSQAILGLAERDLLEQGVPFERCDASVVFGAAHWPADTRDRAEWAQALGLPMLLTQPSGIALLDADSPDILALAEFATCDVILISRVATGDTVQVHCRAGGRAAWLAAGQIQACYGDQIAILGEGDMADLTVRTLQWAGALG